MGSVRTYRSLQQKEAGPRAESAARKTVNDAVERERRLEERKNWLAYGQRWSDEEAAARQRRAIADSGCQPLK
jgi:hypothetical protein